MMSEVEIDSLLEHIDEALGEEKPPTGGTKSRTNSSHPCQSHSPSTTAAVAARPTHNRWSSDVFECGLNPLQAQSDEVEHISTDLLLGEDEDDHIDQLQKMCDSAPTCSSSSASVESAVLPSTHAVGLGSLPSFSCTQSADRDDLERYLADLDAIMSVDILPGVRPQAAPDINLVPSLSKCYPIYIGGTSDENKVCKNLRCTACDHLVIWVQNQRWSPHVDYIFFRNNVPDLGKLRAKLLQEPGSCAFACQCAWQSVHQLVNVSEHHTLRWVCAGH